jgi:hypothetical protein
VKFRSWLYVWQHVLNKWRIHRLFYRSKVSRFFLFVIAVIFLKIRLCPPTLFLYQPDPVIHHLSLSATIGKIYIPSISRCQTMHPFFPRTSICFAVLTFVRLILDRFIRGHFRQDNIQFRYPLISRVVLSDPFHSISLRKKSGFISPSTPFDSLIKFVFFDYSHETGDATGEFVDSEFTQILLAENLSARVISANHSVNPRGDPITAAIPYDSEISKYLRDLRWWSIYGPNTKPLKSFRITVRRRHGIPVKLFFNRLLDLSHKSRVKMNRINDIIRWWETPFLSKGVTL